MLFATRPTSTSRDVKAGCFVCSGMDARWYGGQAQGTAARHHDATGHPTWCDVFLSVRYGAEAPDPHQHDIEDAIASSSGGEPDAAPLTDPDAPAADTAGVSAPKAALSRQRARGRKPEHAHA